MSNFLKDDIIAWLDFHQIKNYTLVPDQVYGIKVDVLGSVDLSEKKLTHIAVQFGKVSEDFYCSNNQLISLEGCPTSVGGSFNCRENNLISLEGCPTSVGRDFYCGDNQLTSLLGGPTSIRGDFSCSGNQLTSLEGGPASVGGGFYCGDNHLTSLEGGPASVGGGFYCNYNEGLGKYQDMKDFAIIRAKITSDNEKKILSNLLGKSHLTPSVLKL